MFETALGSVDKASEKPSSSPLEEAAGEGRGTGCVVECLPDGGYVVETHGAKYAVGGAEMYCGGRMTATVDGRRVAVRATVPSSVKSSWEHS